MTRDDIKDSNQAAPEPKASKTPAPRKTPVRKAPAATAAKPVRKRPVAAAKATPSKAAKPAVKKTPIKKPQAAAKSAAGSSPKKTKAPKAKKVKLVRDSFTMPETEYAAIAALKKRCLKSGHAAKKSEILRAAIAGLAKLSDASVVAAIKRLAAIKTGRPAKGAK